MSTNIITFESPVVVANEVALPATLTTSEKTLFRTTDQNYLHKSQLTVMASFTLGSATVGTLYYYVSPTSVIGTCTITIASPGVVTYQGHGLVTGNSVVFTTTSALPTGITAGTTYYVSKKDANSFWIFDTEAHAITDAGAGTGTGVVNTSGSQSGTQTMDGSQWYPICLYATATGIITQRAVVINSTSYSPDSGATLWASDSVPLSACSGFKITGKSTTASTSNLFLSVISRDN